MSQTIKEDKFKDLDDSRVTKTNKATSKHRGYRPNKKKLTNDEIVKLLSEQGFG